MPQWPLQSEVENIFGRNITYRSGVPDESPTWKAKNLVSVPLPWKAIASWDAKIPVRSLLMHRLVETSLTGILRRIWDDFDQSQEKIEAIHMHRIGGGYNWRLMRGGNRLSMHSYGIAADFDPEHNAFGDNHPKMAQQIITRFKEEGWVWGGEWAKKDGMHFQAARVS